MRSTKSKKLNAQLPDGVVAVNEFGQLINAWFETTSLSEINQLLTGMLSAATGPDPRSGKRPPVVIANALYQVNNMISLFKNARSLAGNEPQNQLCTLHGVGGFDIAQLSELLYYGLNAYIFQEEGYEGTTLKFSAEITHAYSLIYDWFADCHEWCKCSKNLID